MNYFLYFVIIISFFDNFSQFPIISPFAAELGASSFLIGIIVGIYSFSNMLGNVVAGHWIDKMGRKKVLVGGMLIAGISLFLYSFVTTALELVIVRLIHGIGGGLLVPSVFALLSDRMKEKANGRTMAFSGIAIGVAAIAGPAFGGLVTQKYGLIWVFYSVSALMLFTSLCVILLLPDNYQARRAVENEKYYFLHPSQYLKLSKAYLGAFSLMFSVGILTQMLPLKVAELGFGPAFTGMLMSVYGVTAILLFVLPINQLSDRIGRNRPIIYGLLLICVALFVLSKVTTQPLLICAMILFGTGFAILFPAMTALVIDRTDKNERGRAFGLFYAFFSLGVVVGPLFMGSLHVQPDQGLFISSVLLLMISLALNIKKS